MGGLLGLPAVWSGRIVGHVEQGLLTPDGGQLDGLVLRRGMGSARFAPARTVAALGSVSVILAARPRRLSGRPPFRFACVKDTAGLLLGRVTDVYLHPSTLRVAALEVSLGPVEDVLTGRLLARRFALDPQGDGGAQVLIPTGCALERLRTDHGERR